MDHAAPDHASSGPLVVSPEVASAELARVLRSRTFTSAPVLSRLLTYIVQRTIDGSGESLKEYALGVDVFGRGASFDPRIDTIVRVQARRLRERLNDYYVSDGVGDPIRIDVPIGHYVAAFRRVDTYSYRGAPRRAIAPPGSRLGSGPGAAGRSHLPVPLTSLVGRDPDLAVIRRLLRDDTVRLLTLTGAGGSGKTRLALQVGRDVAREFAGGVHLISLAPVRDAKGFGAVVARAFDLRDSGDSPITEALPAYLHDVIAAPTLLLLDNFEHLLELAPLIVALLESAAGLTLLITSRAALEVYGEHEYVVSPLDVPGPFMPFTDLARNPSVTLFAQRAAAANGRFALNETNAPAVAEICRRLDGLPLAIELAAARTRELPLEVLSARLTRTLAVLGEGPRDAPARQRTLRDTLDWSYELLSETQQRLLRRLSVFAGGWTLEAAEAVCNSTRDLGADVAGDVHVLVSQSLVQRPEPLETEARFTMLETVREYALEKLLASDDATHTRNALAVYCIVLAEEGLPRLTEIEREAWLVRCDAEHHNFQTSLDWLVRTRQFEWGLRLGLALFSFWDRREHLGEGRATLLAVAGLRGSRPVSRSWALAMRYAGAFSGGESALTQHQQALDAFRELGDERGVAAQLMSIGVIHCAGGRYSAARDALQQALDICRRLGDRLEVAASLSNLARAVSDDGDQQGARVLLEEALDLFRSIGDETGAARAVSQLGDVARRDGRPEEALQIYEEAAAAFERLGDQWGAARSALDVGHARCDTGGCAAARASFARALVAFAHLRDRRGIARVLHGFAHVALREQRFARALVLFAAGRSIRDAIGVWAQPLGHAALEALIESAWRALGEPVATDTWDAAGRLSLDDAVEFALSDLDLPTTRS